MSAVRNSMNTIVCNTLDTIFNNLHFTGFNSVGLSQKSPLMEKLPWNPRNLTLLLEMKHTNLAFHLQICVRYHCHYFCFFLIPTLNLVRVFAAVSSRDWETRTVLSRSNLGLSGDPGHRKMRGRQIVLWENRKTLHSLPICNVWVKMSLPLRQLSSRTNTSPLPVLKLKSALMLATVSQLHKK